MLWTGQDNKLHAGMKAAMMEPMREDQFVKQRRQALGTNRDNCQLVRSVQQICSGCFCTAAWVNRGTRCMIGLD